MAYLLKTLQFVGISTHASCHNFHGHPALLSATTL